MKKVFVFAIVAAMAVSCVSSKKYKEATGNLSNCRQEVAQLKAQNRGLAVENTELKASVEKLNGSVADLNGRLGATSAKLDEAVSRNKILSGTNDDLEKQLTALKKGSSEEISRLLEKLQQTENDLQSRENKLKQAEGELAQRNVRLMELQEALKQKEDAVAALKQKVMAALTGFNNKGLTIYEKNGKVYVSLEEQLLFKTGQWEVDPKGQQALADLGTVLAQNPDINVLVEGHTDDVPMRGTGAVKDNWDLSVMRSTAVTKILLKNKAIDPKRITSAGRGEFFPIDEAKTPEARQKNRRTEIILTPRLDEIFKLLETN